MKPRNLNPIARAPWLLALCVFPLSAEAERWKPNDGLLSAIAVVESANGRLLYGDDGRSLGRFQICQAAWRDVSAWRRAHGLRTYSYTVHVFHPTISRLYAADYLSLLHQDLSRHLKRPPTLGQLYAAYNMGFSSFAECGFRVSRVNPVTAGKCRAVERMVQAARQNQPRLLSSR